MWDKGVVITDEELEGKVRFQVTEVLQQDLAVECSRETGVDGRGSAVLSR